MHNNNKAPDTTSGAFFMLKIVDIKQLKRYSYSAAINTPNLSEKDRQMLMRDALDRAQEAGVKVNITEIIRRFLYGY